jgi:hypothetical protein
MNVKQMRKRASHAANLKHELRCEGIPVAPAKYFGKNSNGKKIYGYKLMEKV